jgi:hypothetical protein
MHEVSIEMLLDVDQEPKLEWKHISEVQHSCTVVSVWLCKVQLAC